MDAAVVEWLGLALRWFHVFVGILWIGTTYYFTWLDHRMTEAAEESTAPGRPPTVWMVHSGGFYMVEKHKVPELMPEKLHWFRYEALFTWVSGMLLLVLVYYLGAAMIDPGKTVLSHAAGIGVGLGLIAASWFVYDLLWNSPLGKIEPIGAAISYAILVGVAYGLSHVFTGRAAYMHVGAVLGTLMAANVWVRILPAQRQMLAALARGEAPDPTLGARAKARSRHNTFMVVPLVFIMISSHYPSTYGHEQNWLVLAGMMLVGAIAAKVVYHSSI